MPITRSWQRDLDDAEYANRIAQHAEDERNARGIAEQRRLVGQQPIDLQQLVTAVLDGAVGDQPMTALETMDGACDAVIAVVAAKIGRPLMDGERAKVYIEAGSQFNRRREQKRRDLVVAQATFRSPSRVFAR